MENKEIIATENKVATKEKNISDNVLVSLNNMIDNQGLVLPTNYNPTNALKSAYLKLAESNLLNTDKTALAQALLNMCVQGLTPAKNQCYFINYGGKVNMMRSYFGDRAVCLSSGLITDIQAYVIYDGDEVDITFDDGYMVVEHSTNWKNMNNAITGAYAMAILPNGNKLYDIMTIERIKESWKMSKNYGDKNKLTNQFTDDACKRTIIRHLVKNIFNQSVDNNPVVDSYTETTNNEYDYSKETKHENVIDVKAEQQEKTATKKVVIEKPITPEPPKVETTDDVADGQQSLFGDEYDI